MLPLDLIFLGLIAVAAATSISVRTSRLIRQISVVVLLMAGLYGVFGFSLLHRLAWYALEREQHIALPDAEKASFTEGARAAQQQANRFLPVVGGSLVALTVVASRRPR